MTLGLSTEATAVLRRLLKYIRPYRFVVIPAAIAIIVYALVTGVVPYFVQDVFEEFETFEARLLESAQDSGTALEALRLPLIVLGVFALRGIMNFLTIYGLSWVGRSAIRDLRRDLFRHYLYLPAAYYDRHATGDLLSRLTFNAEQVSEAISNALVTMIRDFLLIVIMLVIMFRFSLELTLILTVVGPVVALLLSAMSRAFRRYSSRIQSSMGDVTRVVSQALKGQRVIKVFSGQEFETARFAAINQRNFKQNLRLVAIRAFGDGLTQFVVMFGVAVVGFLVFSGWLDQDIDASVFSGFIASVGILLTSLKRLVGTNAALQRGIAAAESLFEILDTVAEPAAESSAAPAIRVDGNIDFDAVSFRYGDDQEEVLHRVALRLESGQTLAIVGRSGSGKSTLVSLLPRFYDVTSGAIRLDGRDIRDYPLETLRRQFSFVSQDVILFDDTIAGNIAYGALSSASREEIERAAEAAYISDFAAELPQGLDTPVGEAGALMSGGQRQRIAIARAILKDAPILILDEATSALDSESERHVQAALNGLMRARTTLIIAHRLSTVEQADCILVMRDGRIVETGKHIELLAAGGYYSTLYRLQFAE
jgi:subfamily B ATP-binding cassette protein MsbA